MTNKMSLRSTIIATLAIAATALCIITGWKSAQTLNDAGGFLAAANVQSLTQAIMLICAVIGATAGLWVSFSYVVLLRAEHVRRDSPLIRLACRFATPAVRRALAGMTVSSALIIAPATADTGILTSGPDLGWRATTSGPGYADPGFQPLTDRPFDDATPSAADGSNGSSSPDSTYYTVIPGDTLWSIAAKHLPEDASSTDIAAAADAWFLTNSDQISHPHLIHPGQVFTSPRTSS